MNRIERIKFRIQTAIEWPVVAAIMVWELQAKPKLKKFKKWTNLFSL